MSQVLDFIGAAPSPERVQLRVVPGGDERNDFWPEVSGRNAPNEETEVDPKNSPKQVLSEVLALFSVVALLILAVTVLMPGP